MVNFALGKRYRVNTRSINTELKKYFIRFEKYSMIKKY